MDEYVIETSELTRRFQRVLAVDSVALQVPSECVYGFLGPNGAGKTTTIRMLLGLIKPSSGTVRLLGRSRQDKPLELLRQIGSLVEAPSLYAHLTGWENLELVRGLRDAPRSEIARVLQTVNLEADAHRPVGQYSQGMVQRLGLAAALLGAPRLLILDEPTNGLDPAGIHEIRELIRRLPREQGVTLFVSSHLLGEMEQMATHLGIIQAGRLIFQGTTDQLRARYRDHVALQVDQPQMAQQVLEGSGWQAACTGDRRLRVTANGQADAALIATRLVQCGLKLYHLGLEQPSLEDIFLQLTRPAPEGVSR